MRFASSPRWPRLRARPLGLLAAMLLVAAAPAGAWERIELAASGSYARWRPPAQVAGPAPAVVFLHGAGATPELWLPWLEPLVDELGVVVIVPRAGSNVGWGIADDAAAITAAIQSVNAVVPLDPARTSLAGHSAGGAYAYVLAYDGALRAAGVFSMSAPFRHVLDVPGEGYVPPIRWYYGKNDPNYLGGHYAALAATFARLGIVQQVEIAPGHGHDSWPATTLRDGFAFLLAQHWATPGGCFPSAERLCLLDGHYAVEATWSEPPLAGVAHTVVARERDSGLFWFFDERNWELTIKVLDGCGVNGHRWVFAGGLTHVAHTLRVVEMATGRERLYARSRGVQAPLTDTAAFSCAP